MDLISLSKPVRTRIRRWRSPSTDHASAAATVAAEPPEPPAPGAYTADGDAVIMTGRTPNEQLLRLLRRYGGRMYQSDIVDETGLSKSTVSRRLSALERDGQIRRIQIGRSKIVLFPDDEL